jgi:hypothetical protein
MQYGLLSIALKNLATEQALEIDRQIQRQVSREGLRGIVIAINDDEYDELVYALCHMAQHSGIGPAIGSLIKHIKYFMRKNERFK